MAAITLYGIKNCDTMKKAFAWFDAHKIAYAFHDYKKDGADEKVLKAAIKSLGWESVINRKGTTWRALPEKTRAGMDEAGAIRAAIANPSLIKRPLVVSGAQILAGFDETAYAGLK